MSRRIKVLLSIAIVAVLVMVGVGSVALAQTPPPTTTPTKTLLARVAEIIGGNVTEQKLADAFRRANLETRNERIDKVLQKAVEGGRITQQQADQIKQWWQQRPAAVDSLIGPRVLPASKGQLARVAEILGIPEETLVNAFKQAAREMRADAFNRALDKAVSSGRLTQEQADKIREKVGGRAGAIPSLKGIIRGWGQR